MNGLTVLSVCVCVCVCVLGELLVREREGEVRERKYIELGRLLLTLPGQQPRACIGLT